MTEALTREPLAQAEYARASPRNGRTLRLIGKPVPQSGQPAAVEWFLVTIVLDRSAYQAQTRVRVIVP
jgi:hypothetical protein